MMVDFRWIFGWVAFGLALSLASLAHDARADEVLVEEGALTGDEKVLVQKIKSAYPDLLLSEKARRYYTVHPETKAKLPVSVELVFEVEDGLIGGQFAGYSAMIDPNGPVFTYAYDAGTSSRGSGSVIVQGDKVIKTENACGTTACSVTVQENGKTVYQSPQ